MIFLQFFVLLICDRIEAMKANTNQGCWQPFVVEEDTCYTWYLKQTLLHVYKHADAWFVHMEAEPGEERWGMGETLESVPDLPWTRYIVGKENTLLFVPVVPDRPLILKPSTPVKLLPGKKATFYFEIPLWVKLLSKGERSQSFLFEVPLTSFSHIWFGDPAEGELCYSLDVDLITETDVLERCPYHAVATVHIRNSSALQLDLQKILLHTDYLYLFRQEEKIWTDEITYQFRGTEQSSQISFSKRPPAFMKHAPQVSGPRVPAVQSLIKRSFGILKDFTGF
jgi:hypothetical protein